MNSNEDIELAKVAIAEADDEQLSEIIHHVIEQCREQGWGAGEILAACYGEVVVAEAETLDDLLGGWAATLVEAAHKAFDGEVNRGAVFGFVLEFAAGSAFGLGLPLEVGRKIVDSAHAQLQQILTQMQERQAQEAADTTEPKGFAVPGALKGGSR